jgi:hypothetical protein
MHHSLRKNLNELRGRETLIMQNGKESNIHSVRLVWPVAHTALYVLLDVFLLEVCPFYKNGIYLQTIKSPFTHALYYSFPKFEMR